MKATSTFKVGLEKLDSLWRPGQFGKALTLVDRLLGDWPDNPLLLVKRAQLIQLQEGGNGPSLEQARALLERAAELEDECPSAVIELGVFHYAVQDDAAVAVDWFTRAETQLVRLLKECRKGKRAAVAELAKLRARKGFPDQLTGQPRPPATIY